MGSRPAVAPALASPQQPLRREGIPPEAEYAQLERAFLRAWTDRPDVRRTACFLFADKPVRLRVVGGELAGILFRAFSHLRVAEQTEPVLTIDVWDEGETEVGVEGLRAGPDLNAPGETFVSNDGRIVVTARTQTRTVFDRRRHRIVGWVGRSERLTQYEIGRPLHTELILWHKDRDVQAIHAGLVARGAHGVLFGGPAGSGKSTVALSCLEAGYQYISDDYVGLGALPDGGFVGHSLYCSAHLEPEHLRRFPDLQPYAIPGRLPREDKSLVMLSDARPEGLGQRARIRAVVLPRVTGSDGTSLRPASKVQSMLRLAPSSLLLLPCAGIAAREFNGLARLLESVPTYWLELGQDLDEIPKRVGQILDMHS